jgi:hypothetical protein
MVIPDERTEKEEVQRGDGMSEKVKMKGRRHSAATAAAARDSPHTHRASSSSQHKKTQHAKHTFTAIVLTIEDSMDLGSNDCSIPGLFVASVVDELSVASLV